ncbi:MAG: Smr/MutS family protein [Pseudomonadota bacterium]
MKKEDNISEEESKAFLEAAAGAKRIERESPGRAAFKGKEPLLHDEAQEWKKHIRRLMKGSLRDFDITLSTEYVEGRRKTLGSVTMNRLRKGEIAVEAAVDLHGLNRSEAKKKVHEFVQESRKKGKRCVLIVHGRGKGSKEGIPVLKQGLVAWLNARSGIGRHIMGFATARACDGGPGAVYVLLDK